MAYLAWSDCASGNRLASERGLVSGYKRLLPLRSYILGHKGSAAEQDDDYAHVDIDIVGVRQDRACEQRQDRGQHAHLHVCHVSDSPTD